MAYSELRTNGQTAWRGATQALTWERAIVALAFAAAIVIYIPAYIKLYNGPWQTEQEGHGPLIMLASAWLVWRKREDLAGIVARPAYISGWLLLIASLFMMVVSRSQDLLVIETGTQILVFLAIVLLAWGWAAAKIVAFPLAFMIFSVPPPGWALDALTVPLKAAVSDVVAVTLYDLGYPIAQNGVVIMVGAYELMVKDACSGMNSLFALSAIGVFYIYEFVRDAPIRGVILALAVIPVAVGANLLRVFALVLGAYYLGVDQIEGTFHDVTGILLFIAAVALFFSVDAVLLFMVWIFNLGRRRVLKS